jgi:hypothetical protein
MSLRIRRITEDENLRRQIAAERDVQARLLSAVGDAFLAGWEWGGGEKSDPSQDPEHHRNDMFDYWWSDRINDCFR